MIPEWFGNLFFVFIAVLIVCGAILATMMLVAVVAEFIRDLRKRQRKR